MNEELSLGRVIAQRIGELTVQTIRQSVLIETLKMELARRDDEIAKLKAIEPELPIAAYSHTGATNGSAH